MDNGRLSVYPGAVFDGLLRAHERGALQHRHVILAADALVAAVTRRGPAPAAAIHTGALE